MATERINGIKMDLGRLSDDEVLGVLGHATERSRVAQDETDRLVGHAVMRGLLAIEDVPGMAQDDPNQLTIDFER